jgi:hypothetical protein
MAIGAVHKTDFKPNMVQGNFIESRAKADLFSSRMGEGKSTALAWAALYHTRHNPGASWVLVRDTFENIVGTTQKTFFQWFPPGIFGEYNASRKTFKWASGVADGDVTFMGLDDQQDASKLMSREIAGFGIDEPAPAVGTSGVDEFIFDMAMSRLRQPGMNWYAAKLAENNPDEGHWTYKKFVSPGTPDFCLWQPQIPENVLHLPPNYYEALRGTWASRPDLLRRFVEGEFGFQQIGKSVTPQWNERLHLALQLAPLPRTELVLCWDFGLNPSCAITQRTPLGHWNILDAMVGEGIGAQELINDWVKPLLVQRYSPLKCTMRHIGDPAGNTREQSSAERSAVRVIRQELGGPWKSGPVKIDERLEPLRAVLTRTVGGRGLVQVDRERAAPVWHALRGGWHYHVARTGIVSGVPAKGPGPHSHIGDALGYGAAVLFPMGRLQKSALLGAIDGKGATGYFGGRPSGLPPERGLERKPGLVPRPTPPEHGATL